MKEVASILIVFALSFGLSKAQPIERSVIASAGGVSISGTSILSWNVGETVVATVSTGNIILSQGFEQFIATPTFVNPINSNINVQVYPNPTTGLLAISYSGDVKSGGFDAQLIDLTGKIVWSHKKLNLINGTASIKLDGVDDGCYFLKLFLENKTPVTFKITLIN